jgi:transcription elongation factor Elf1
MKTYYCVKTEFYSDGRVEAAMISQECKEKPKSTSRELFRMDAYNDWFDNLEEAEAFLAEARAEGKGAEGAA